MKIRTLVSNPLHDYNDKCLLEDAQRHVYDAKCTVVYYNSQLQHCSDAQGTKEEEKCTSLYEENENKEKYINIDRQKGEELYTAALETKE